MFRFLSYVVLSALLPTTFLMVSCKKDEPLSAQAQLVQEGKSIYQTQCTACHNSDATKPGVLGPEVANSSLELLEARILRVEYPKGYKPKRDTSQMQPLAHLKDKIPAIHAYLQTYPISHFTK